MALCRMFKQAIRGASLPKYLSSDHDPLYRFHQCEANLRILGVTEIKTVPYTPWSHPFVERLIGTIRRDCLDRLLFWTSQILKETDRFQELLDGYRCHADGVKAAWGVGFGAAQVDYTGNLTRAFSTALDHAQQPGEQGDFREMFRTSADGSVRGQEYIMK